MDAAGGRRVDAEKQEGSMGNCVMRAGGGVLWMDEYVCMYVCMRACTYVLHVSVCMGGVYALYVCANGEDQKAKVGEEKWGYRRDDDGWV